MRIQRLEDKLSVALHEVAHDERPLQVLRCLQIQLFSSLVLKELKQIWQCFAYSTLENLMNLMSP